MSSRDLTSSLILLMSGAPGLRRVSWTLRMGASWVEDCRIPRYTLTAISGESPQGGFRHLPRKIDSLAVSGGRESNSNGCKSLFESFGSVSLRSLAEQRRAWPLQMRECLEVCVQTVTPDPKKPVFPECLPRAR